MRGKGVVFLVGLILCCLLGSQGLSFACERGHAVIVLGDGDILDGDTIEGGYDGGIDIVGDAVVKNCTIRNNACCGIHIWQGNPTIENCVIEDNGTRAISIFNRTGAADEDWTRILTPNKPTIQYNTISITGASNSGAPNIHLEDWSSAYIAKNLIMATPDNLTVIYTGNLESDIEGTVKPPLEIYNNTFYHDPYTETLSYIELYGDVSAVIQNNIFIDEPNLYDEWISGIRDCTSGNCQALYLPYNAETHDPLEFVNYPSDLNLSLTSSLIDAGVDVGLPYSGTAPDLGAYEVNDVCPSGCMYSSIQAAINAASSGGIITIGDGTYYENINFNGKAITVRSENGADATIIDGGNSGSVVTFNSGETASSILDGFTLQNGSASWGGGVYSYNASPTVTNCNMQDNTASYGGGIACRGTSSMDISNCKISGNSANYYGGGIFYYYSYSGTTITNSTISGNRANYYGGGMFTWRTSPTINSCTISGNLASSYYGGGMFAYSNSFPTATNSILWANKQGASYNQIYLMSGSSVNITFSDIQGGWAGTGNISSNPLFADPQDASSAPTTAGDYHLQVGSPSIDTGTSTGAPPADIDGDTRPQGTGYDMGSDEVISTTCTDVDGDGYCMEVDDCDDADPAVNPGATETCDGIDNNCNGIVDEGCSPSSADVCPSGCTYTSIQAAISASTNGDTIVVGNGTYLENINFLGRTITVISENGPYSTIIDGNQNDSVVTFDSNETATTILDGFTLQNGLAMNGGGVYCDNTAPTIKNCVITGNTATESGAGVYCMGGPWAEPITIINTNIVDNTTDGWIGGAIYMEAGTWSVITNSTISGNSQLYEPFPLCFRGGGTHEITNTIVWGNSGDIYIDGGSSVNVSYSDIEGGYPGGFEGGTVNWGSGNINLTPLFSNAASGDYHLQLGSPCIDAGTSSGAPVTDIDGDSRPQGLGYEMGSDEYMP